MYQDLKFVLKMILNKEIVAQMEFSRKKPIKIIITYFPASYSSILSFNFLPMNKRRSNIYITSFVATIEMVFPDLPALAVLPDL